MFYIISNSLKKRFVSIFQDILARHPIFEKVKVYTKFPQEERPKTAILVRSVSGSSQKLGLDNFIGTHRGYCSLANLKDVPGNSIEWVRDDQENLDKLVSQGFYIVKITEHDLNTNVFSFTVDPYLTCTNEKLDLVVIRTHQGAILKNIPVNPGSEIVFSEHGQFEFKKDIDYAIDYETGEILFTNPVTDHEPIVIDYQVRSAQQGPFVAEYYGLNNTAIPGVVLAFGDRLKVGDEQVVVVEEENTTTAKVFGGRWILNVDILGVAQDADQQERVIDYVVTSLWADYQDALANEGIAISEFALSGEAEDLEVEVPEEYNFTGGISFTVETDWEIYIPLIATVRRINYGYGEDSFKNGIDYLKEQAYETNQYDERQMNSRHQKGLQIVPTMDAYQVYPSAWPRVTRKYQQE
ncbi:MAG: hypothetical protein PHF86_04145 [Candidatus Nanoarchaeia archaeon]|jgi:hypothetical protein|nr:hypothetical protein [Candidatus Nanoarchaeia archaeon]